MFSRLLLRNIGHSLRDYAVYFLTLMLVVCIFYVFNSVNEQQYVLEQSPAIAEGLRLLGQAMPYLSLVVAVTLGFLIIYANRYFVRRRHREFGIYILLGMPRWKVSLILILETALIAVLSLWAGLVLGIFLSQFMAVFAARIFEVHLGRFHFLFSRTAFFRSILYFGVIFLIVVVFNGLAVSRVRLIRLLYDAPPHEAGVIRRPWLAVGLFLLSLAGLYWSYRRLGRLGLTGFAYAPRAYGLMLLAGLGSTVLFFYSVMGVFALALRRVGRVYYQGLHAYMIRQLGSLFHSNFFSLAVVNITLLLAIGVFASGFSLQNMYSQLMQNSNPFDIAVRVSPISGDSAEKMALHVILPQDFADEGDIAKSVQHPVYGLRMHSGTVGLPGAMQPRVAEPIFQALALSDTNRLLDAVGQRRLTLAAGNFKVIYRYQADFSFAMQVARHGWTYFSRQGLLRAAGVERVPALFDAAGGSLRIIVPDGAVSLRQSIARVLNLNASGRLAAERMEKRLVRFARNWEGHPDYNVEVESRARVQKTALGTKSLIAFVCLYLGLVFLLSCAAILAIQQLSHVADNRRRFLLLRRLGADRRMLNAVLVKQLAVYFGLPLLLAGVHAFFGLRAAQKTLWQQFGVQDMREATIVTLLFVACVWGAYFFATYLSARTALMSFFGHRDLRQDK